MLEGCTFRVPRKLLVIFDLASDHWPPVGVDIDLDVPT